MSNLTASNQNLPETAYDQPSGERKPAAKSAAKPPAKSDEGGAAVSPRDTDSGTVRETPEGPSDRPGTEAEADAQRRP